VHIFSPFIFLPESVAMKLHIEKFDKKSLFANFKLLLLD